jgi:hypothetical protein
MLAGEKFTLGNQQDVLTSWPSFVVLVCSLKRGRVSKVQHDLGKSRKWAGTVSSVSSRGGTKKKKETVSRKER